MPDLATRTEAVVPPADCPDMETLRGQIDRIDRALVALVAERTGYIARAAEIKQRRDTVHDDARIEDVVSKVLAAAGPAGLSPDIAEPVWRTLIDRCIAHELAAWDRTRG